MNALRFGKTDIRLSDAAIILATSQEEWATYWEKDYISTEKDFHDILVRPHPRVPAGWVYLERTL
jgi:hypothetical protein